MWTSRQNKSIRQRDDGVEVGRRPDGGSDQTIVLVFRSREFLRAETEGWRITRDDVSSGHCRLPGAGRRNAEEEEEEGKEN